ncbi:hypothetical protein [Stenotrophomonas sp. GD03958]|uniref:hypothetical protein n=1 Tax=Stenotrophomonas sp. GD03958 TaxID=2975411 RepID=UPI0007397BD7|nr:hypothetical protein [Stenotrophomonas sp. GD03958]MCU1088566.1 hypothetical protein [Stenotrophomonas maltophilia]MDH1194887.1 hypothetical protein [Stenotrophomonas sp. GD03958]CRD54374.1 membrane hypothetical protein [Stenotrophomonas maltophilia]
MYADSLFRVYFACSLAIAGCAGCIHQFLLGQPLLALAIMLSVLTMIGAALVTRRLALPGALAMACTVFGLMAKSA